MNNEIPPPATKRTKTSNFMFKLTKFGTPAIVIPILLIFTISSIIVRDTAYATKYPWKFTVETLLMAFVATFPFMFIIWSRTGTIGVHNVLEYVLLIIKFAGLHLLFQFSGIYTLLFPQK